MHSIVSKMVYSTAGSFDLSLTQLCSLTLSSLQLIKQWRHSTKFMFKWNQLKGTELCFTALFHDYNIMYSIDSS